MVSSFEPTGLDALLAALAADRVLAAQRYLELRGRLVRFFAWRQVSTPEDLADETLDRVCRRLADGVRIEAEDPALYVHGVARNVLREHWVRERNAPEALGRGA